MLEPLGVEARSPALRLDRLHDAVERRDERVHADRFRQVAVQARLEAARPVLGMDDIEDGIDVEFVDLLAIGAEKIDEGRGPAHGVLEDT